MTKRADQAVLSPVVTLECGHETAAQAVVIYPDRRKSMFRCPAGCGLQKRVK